MKPKLIYKYVEELGNTYSAVQTDDGIYWCLKYCLDKYKLHGYMLTEARKNGLPYIKEGGKRYYREKDINDYYAGKIGYDVEGAKANDSERNT